MYTDGSKSLETGKTGFGVFVPELGISMKKRTTDHLAIFTVELMAIIAALYWIEECGMKKVIMCSDSSSYFWVLFFFFFFGVCVCMLSGR